MIHGVRMKDLSKYQIKRDLVVDIVFKLDIQNDLSVLQKMGSQISNITAMQNEPQKERKFGELVRWFCFFHSF